LKKIGYNIYNLSNLLEIVDTASMWRVLKREKNPRNLGENFHIPFRQMENRLTNFQVPFLQNLTSLVGIYIMQEMMLSTLYKL